MGPEFVGPVCVFEAVASPYDVDGLYSATAADIFDNAGFEAGVDSLEVDFAGLDFLAAA